MISATLPRVTVEHIGSTSVPGCAGKGIIDLMVLYPDGDLEAVKDALKRLGFQPQTVGHLMPESRPMRVGAVRYQGRIYRLHVHVIAASSPEVQALRAFRGIWGSVQELPIVASPNPDHSATLSHWFVNSPAAHPFCRTPAHTRAVAAYGPPIPWSRTGRRRPTSSADRPDIRRDARCTATMSGPNGFREVVAV